MITYEETLSRLRALQDDKYAAFHKRLLKNDSIELIGVRTPQLRALAKEWKGEQDIFLSFPDEYYEITLLKCALVGMLPYNKFIGYIDSILPLLNNWATCDLFEAPCIKKHREEFLPFIRKYLQSGKEFTVRYALVALLRYYMDREYLTCIFDCVEHADEKQYYIMMGAAWLIAEVLVKFYEEGVAYLSENRLPAAVHNKAIQKACESFRIAVEQKAELKSLRR